VAKVRCPWNWYTLTAEPNWWSARLFLGRAYPAGIHWAALYCKRMVDLSRLGRLKTCQIEMAARA